MQFDIIGKLCRNMVGVSDVANFKLTGYKIYNY